jgi:hypothetical protein
MLEFLFGLSPGLFVGVIILAFISLVSQMSLYAKAGQPAIAALVPVWNVMVFCKVVGRPASHAWFLLAPGIVIMGIAAAYWPLIDGLFPVHCQGGEWCAGSSSFSDVTLPFALMGIAALPIIYYVIVMFTEVCDSFGKHSTMDKVMAVIFNGFYILFVLGISTAKYESPWWSRKRGRPYYMPDFKHKGKKYLVTPEGPLKGDYRKQKMKVDIVDVSPSNKTTGDIRKEAAVSEPKIVDKPKTSGAAVKVVIPVKDVQDKTPDTSTRAQEKLEKKVVKVTEIKKVSKKQGGKSKPAEKKAADGSSVKTWREEMTEKYKKKK